MREILRSHIESGTVTYRYDNRRTVQVEAYNECLQEFGKDNEWIGFLDSDEFLVLKQHRSVRELLSGYKAFGALSVGWYLFGSNGHLTKQKSVIRSYTTRVPTSCHYKTFVQPKAVLKFTIHDVALHAPGYYTVDEQKNPVHGPFTRYQNTSICQINHYVVRSLDDFREKMARGCADGSTPKSISFFDDINRMATVEDNSITPDIGSIVKSRFFIISGGKTGSSTLSASFANSKHLHSSNHFHHEYRRFTDKSISDLYDFAIQKCLQGEKIVIISAVREPIARVISSFFQNIGIHLKKTEKEIAAIPITELIEIFNQRFLFHLENYSPFSDNREPSGNDYGGLNLLTIPFDINEKCLFFENDTRRILIIRFDEILEWDSIIRRKLPPSDLKAYKWRPTNLTEQKWYGRIQKQFIRQYKLSPEVVEKRYELEIDILKHFYQDAEIERMKARWCR